MPTCSSVFARTEPRDRGPGPAASPQRRVAASVMAGGLLVMLGAWLPWLTMFAGLQRYAGVIGFNGRLLFASGVIAFVGGLYSWWRSGSELVWGGVTILGLAITGFAGWLLLGLYQMVQHGLDAMLIARPGPGLFVVLLGALLITAAPLSLRRSGAPPATAPLVGTECFERGAR
jgi:hypothetical protein